MVTASNLGGQIQADDRGATPARALLTIHGPNDGEPLNNRKEFSVEVYSQTVAYLAIYQGSRFIALHPVKPGSQDGPVVVTFSLDTTFFPNGPVDLHAYLFDGQMGALLAGSSWAGTVDNPDLEIPVQSLPVALLGILEGVKVHGRLGDRTYRIVAGTSLADLLASPEVDQPPASSLEILSEGEFSAPVSPGGSDGGRPVEAIALKVDSLVRQGTRDGILIVLWCKNAGGKWAHAKPIALRGLLSGRSGILQGRPPAKSPGPLIYQR